MQYNYQTSFKEFNTMRDKGNLIPVGQVVPFDKATPVSVFLKIGKQSRSFLLETPQGAIIGLNPIVKMGTKDIGRFKRMKRDLEEILKERNFNLELLNNFSKKVGYYKVMLVISNIPPCLLVITLVDYADNNNDITASQRFGKARKKIKNLIALACANQTVDNRQSNFEKSFWAYRRLGQQLKEFNIKSATLFINNGRRFRGIFAI